MGIYINPPDMEKEDWLRANAKSKSIKAKYSDKEDDELFIVLIDNQYFSAAGVCYCEKEFNEFMDPRDYRPRALFVAKLDDIRKVCPNIDKWIR